jgi:hypothetical protein
MATRIFAHLTSSSPNSRGRAKTTMALLQVKVLSPLNCFLVVALILLLADDARAFSSPGGSTTVPKYASTASSTTRPTTTWLSMVKFDGEKWVTERPEETSANNYPLINSLLLHGPKPFLTRLLQPNDYEQAILKFMASDKVDRINAQGNMDKYLQNPQDWAYNRMEEQKKGVRYDYVTLNPKQIVLVVCWSAVVMAVIARIVYSTVNHEGFVRTMHYCRVYCRHEIMNHDDDNEG